MFAKLKKKIQDDGGSVPQSLQINNNDSAQVHGPGIASPIKNPSTDGI